MTRSRALLLLLGLAAASPTGLARAAENPLDLLLKQQEKMDRQQEQVQRPAATPQVSLAPPVASVPRQRTYCVRTCDGYFFAIGTVRKETDLTEHGAMCAAACEGTEMRLYSTPVGGAGPEQGAAGSYSPTIETATDGGGQPYTALPQAFAFRDGIVDGCTCKATESGLPRIPFSVDTTLRDGDVVVTGDGLKVFRGKTAGPHPETDFVSATANSGLSGAARKELLPLQDRIAR